MRTTELCMYARAQQLAWPHAVRGARCICMARFAPGSRQLCSNPTKFLLNNHNTTASAQARQRVSPATPRRARRNTSESHQNRLTQHTKQETRKQRRESLWICVWWLCANFQLWASIFCAHSAVHANRADLGAWRETRRAAERSARRTRRTFWACAGDAQWAVGQV